MTGKVQGKFVVMWYRNRMKVGSVKHSGEENEKKIRRYCATGLLAQ